MSKKKKGARQIVYFTVPFFPTNREKFRKIYFSVDFLSFLYYIKTLNSAGKFIFCRCPRRKRLFVLEK
jgi:hypothetical protein